MLRALPLLLVLSAACATDPADPAGADAGRPDAATRRPDAGAPDAGGAGLDAGPDPDPGANLSFEFPALADGAEQDVDPVAWTVERTGSATAGVRRPATAPGIPAEGAQAAWLRIATDDDQVKLASLPLATIAASQRYLVRVAAGAPAAGAVASLGLALTGADDSDALATASIIGDLLERGAFEEHTLDWTAPADGDLLGQPLRLRIQASGMGGTGTAYIDNVRLVEGKP